MQMVEWEVADTAATVQAAAIIVTILPTICIYPFVRKYVVGAIIPGGVRG